jgi:hypothetical protein
MGWFDSVVTVATGGLNKAIPAAKKAGAGKILTTVATGGANIALGNKKVASAVNKLTAPVGKRVAAAATAMRLPSIATNINVKKLVTDPVGYVKSNASAYAKDATVAVSIYNNLKKGNVKGIITQGIADTKAAASAVATGKTPAVAWTLDAPVLPSPMENTPSYSQLTGDTPLYNNQPTATEQQTYVESETTQKSKTPLLVIGALALVVVLVMVVT